MTCLVSGGADSTCLWHALRELGYDVSAVHVHHGVRGADADADAAHCATVLGARVVQVEPAATEAGMRELRYEATAGLGLRATGHTACDQVETVLYRLVSSGSTRGIKMRREDGVVRPLLDVTREETSRVLRRQRAPVRIDATNPDTARGLIRDEILPLLRRLHPGVDANLRALGEERPASRAPSRARSSNCSRRGRERRRQTSAAASEPCASTTCCASRAPCSGGPGRSRADRPDLEVRARRPGDHLAGRRKKVQDLLVDAKVPRAERDDWPVVVSGEDVVAVPGIAVAPGWEGAVTVRRVGR